MTIETYAASVHWGRAVEVTLFKKQPAGDDLVASPLLFVAQPMDGGDTPPTMRLKPDEAQALAEALWKIGVRPHESRQNSVELAALKAHLADMRTISLGMLKPLIGPQP